MPQMSLAQIIKNAQSANLTDEEGGQIEIELMPGMTPDEIDQFASTIPCALPSEIRDLLSFCRGFTGSAADFVDFTGRDCCFEAEVIFPHGLPIAADGFGNFWVVDLGPDSDRFGPIYFACHDAPVILYQCSDIEEFLVELFKMNEPPYRSAVDDVHEDRLFDVWRKNPGVMPAAQARDADDQAVRAFADDLDDAWFIIDLRRASPGMGFSWGRYGPKTEIRRAGNLPIFGYKKPKGVLGRLFGR